MLTRLHVRGFKNLVDVDVRFGPFTCIAGLNGVGKSNLFDAILFLSALADQSLLEAATGVRHETRSAEAGRIFTRIGDVVADELSLEAEMLVPRHHVDDLGQPAEATTTALRYSVGLRLAAPNGSLVPRLELTHERLDYLKRGESDASFPFAKGRRDWLESVLQGRRTTPFISTEQTPEGVFVKVHEDSGHQGRARRLRADGLTRTLLSTMNTSENPTALVARREIQSWRLLQLEPSQLRRPDDLRSRPALGESGSGLAATVHRLLGGATGEANVRARLVNRLSELVDTVRDVRVDVDEKRELITLLVRGDDGVEHRARDLSDGTLRFLALAVMQLDASQSETLCMEEPENGIHPTRVPAMLELLQDLAVDLDEPVGDDNPLRQVIVNTHSPQVASTVPPDSLIFASNPSSTRTGPRGLQLQPLERTWRSSAGAEPVSRGRVVEMLSATQIALSAARAHHVETVGTREEFVQLLLPIEGGR